MAPMLSAVLGALFLKENPDKKTWTTIFITFLAATYIFYDSIQLGNFFGDIFGFITALGLAIGADGRQILGQELNIVLQPWSIGLAAGVAILVGFVSGVYPAIRAASVDPIVALRNE